MNQKENKSKLQGMAKQVSEEANGQEKAKKYTDYVNTVTPKPKLFVNMVKAFFVGGALCTLGQFFISLASGWGATKEDAALYSIIALVFLAVLFTGLNGYQKLTKFGGAGALVPITGFANSVGAPAIEFKKEGQVFGIGAKIFTIAGPVILYGIFTSWVLGVVYWVYTLFAK